MKKLLLITIILLTIIAPASAFVDLIAPSNDEHTKAEQTNFEYYIGLTNPQTCELKINSQTFPGNNVQQGINTISVQNIPEGEYQWYIQCQNTTTSRQSTERTITIDRTKPTIQLTRPDLADNKLLVRLQTQDDKSNKTSCTIKKDNTILEQTTINTNEWFEKTYEQLPGDYELNVTCQDKAGNKQTIIREYTIEYQDFFSLTTNKQNYALGEKMYLTINAPSDANITIDVCPNKQGFVECLSPIILQNYPQTIQLPLNQTGSFIVDGFMQTPRGTIFNSTTYTIDNTIQLSLQTQETITTNTEFKIVATAQGMIGQPSYEWTFHNATKKTTTTNEITQKHLTPGVRTDSLTITDEAGNKQTTMITYEVTQTKEVTIIVQDQNNNPLANASITRSDTSQTQTTNTQGRSIITLPLGTTSLYVSKEGYGFSYEEHTITSTTQEKTIILTQDTSALTITLVSPNNNSQASTANIRFTLQGPNNAQCSLYLGTSQDSFLEEKRTITANKGENGFIINDLLPNTYSYFVECSAQGQTKNTPTRTITITNTTTTTSQAQTVAATTTGIDESIDAIIDEFDRALAVLASTSVKEQELLTLFRVENQLRAAKRIASMAARDVFDLERKGGSQEEKEEIITRIQTLAQQTISTIKVHEDKTYVAYINEEEIQAIINEHEQQLQLPTNNARLLNQAQQSYTLTTKVYRATITYANGQEQPISLVHRELSYADSLRAKELIEVLPDKNAHYEFITAGHKKINDELASFKPGETIIYYATKDLTITQLEQTRLLLIPETIATNRGVTGYSVYGLIETPLEHKNKLAFLALILITLWLVNYFGLIEQAKYLAYQGGKKKPLHYMRVLLNDVHDELAANNFEKAQLIYKEAKLTYEQLSIPAKNETYEDLIRAVNALDAHYLKELVIVMNDALKQEHLEEAIECFAKIEGTYERLPEEQQGQVRNMVEGLAKRLGVSA